MSDRSRVNCSVHLTSIQSLTQPPETDCILSSSLQAVPALALVKVYAAFEHQQQIQITNRFNSISAAVLLLLRLDRYSLMVLIPGHTSWTRSAMSLHRIRLPAHSSQYPRS